MPRSTITVISNPYTQSSPDGTDEFKNIMRYWFSRSESCSSSSSVFLTTFHPQSCHTSGSCFHRQSPSRLSFSESRRGRRVSSVMTGSSIIPRQDERQPADFDKAHCKWNIPASSSPTRTVSNDLKKTDAHCRVLVAIC
jgi:hypothetical protein